VLIVHLGCCQLIKIDESTFGDKVIHERFGYCPKPNDSMTYHIMGNYSEDSIHASIIFSLSPEKRTSQALRAKAFTVVPQNMTVFLSQRKRWALGSISNEFVMIFRPGIIAIERLQSIIAVLTWSITPFIITAVVELVILMIRRGVKLWEDKFFVGLMCVLWFRYVRPLVLNSVTAYLIRSIHDARANLYLSMQIYSFCIGFWLPRNGMERLQYFVGYFMHFFTSPFMNIIVLAYSLFHSDDFKWGKTREVVKAEGENPEEGEHRRPMLH
jgi:chitin synthase